MIGQRMPAAVVSILLLLGLLTWISLRGMNPERPVFDRAAQALDAIDLAESAIQRDVLSARTGLLRNYDPLVRDVNELQAALHRLQQVAILIPGLEVPLDRLARSIERQAALTEEFKSHNALLQNAMTYFAFLSTNLGAANSKVPLDRAISDLSAAVLNLSLDTSPAVVQEVDDRLNDLSARLAAPGEPDAVMTLYLHGRELRDLLPATADILKELVRLPLGLEGQAIRGILMQRRAGIVASADRYRMLLYATSLLLLAALVYLALALRSRALTLRRRAAFEHLLAGISTGFINAPPGKLDVAVSEALGEIARHIGADRAYLVLTLARNRTLAWRGPSAEAPPGWLDEALALSRHFVANAEGIIHVPRVADLAPGPVRDRLSAAGLRAWACVPHFDARGELVGILGFDALSPTALRRPGELGLLRMALDAVANALGRERLERERARLETQLNQARRMETVGALASGIAHNFNNIVGAILGYVEMAELQAGPGDRVADKLSAIRLAGERAGNLVDQIMAFGRRRDVQHLPVDIAALIDEAAALLRASLPAGITLAIGRIPAPMIVSGEAVQLQQVILNICNNAAQAMDGNGEIGIAVERSEVGAEQSLRQGELRPGPYIRIAIRDTGIGMEPATLNRIFDPFFTTRRTGNGLGLATVREIVSDHGGALDVASVPGAGSRFEVWLPRAGAVVEAPAGDIVAVLPALPLGHGETLMLVNTVNERLQREEEGLAALGYEPVGFVDPAQALAAFGDAPGRFDGVVICAMIQIEEMLDFAARLRGMTTDLPIIIAMLSSHTVDAETLAAAGATEVVTGPLASSEMAYALARALRANQSRSTGSVKT